MGKAVVIKLDQSSDNVFERPSWKIPEFGPFKAKLNEDETLTIGIPSQEPEVCTPTVGKNERGEFTYYMFKMYGGVAFASVIKHDKYGTYLRLRLGDEVKLPQKVLDSMKPPKSASAPKKASNAGALWD